MIVTDTGTSFLDTATGKSVFSQLNTTNDYGTSGDKYPTAYADGVFYLLCDTPSKMGLLAAFDAADGTVKWATKMADVDPGGDMSTGMYLSNYVAVMGDTVYVCGQVSGSFSDTSPTTGFIRAYDASTGKRRWQVKGTDINNVLVPPWVRTCWPPQPRRARSPAGSR